MQEKPVIICLFVCVTADCVYLPFILCIGSDDKKLKGYALRRDRLRKGSVQRLCVCVCVRSHPAVRSPDGCVCFLNPVEEQKEVKKRGKRKGICTTPFDAE